MKKILLTACLVIGFVTTSDAQENLKIGDKAPNFQVTTFGDEVVKLSDRVADNDRPVILVFSRANW